MTQGLLQLLDETHRPRILVVGDVMLDRYVWGNVERISYEAPIPVLRLDRREDRLGGAGSVVSILASLGTQVHLLSVTGDDSEGQSVRKLLEELHVPGDTVFTVPGRCTTVKQRLLGRTQSRHPQQMIRVDWEEVTAIPEELAERVVRRAERLADAVDAVLISDYRKGFCDGNLVPRIAAAYRSRGIPVIADPARDVDYRRYAGCTAITPNRTEAGNAAGRAIVAPEDGVDVARQLLAFGVDVAIVTLDRDGIAWADASGRADRVAAVQHEVHDVTGAGDAVLSTLGYAVAVGGDWPAAVRLANLAGGLEVQRLGVVPFTRSELRAELDRSVPVAARKIVALDELQMRLRERRQRGHRVVMTNGCFDLLHPGHVASLQFARRQGDCLVVGLNSDRSIANLKGPERPIFDEQGRAEMLAALACVDLVVIFDDSSVEGLVRAILPDVLVKSAEYTPEQVVGQQIVLDHGGLVLLAPMQGNYNTSRVVERIRSGSGY